MYSSFTLKIAFIILLSLKKKIFSICGPQIYLLAFFALIQQLVFLEALN